jgi:hypothetical protein
VKAEIAQPEAGATVPQNSSVRIHGAAWSGEAEITKVEISVDAGATWRLARLSGPPVKNAWRLWEYDWATPPNPGTHTIMARATDTQGRSQPFERAADHGTYMINHVLPVAVNVG